LIYSLKYPEFLAVRPVAPIFIFMYLVVSAHSFQIAVHKSHASESRKLAPNFLSVEFPSCHHSGV